MRLLLHVDYLDGSGVDLEASTPDLIAFERKFDKPFTILGSGLRLEWICWLSWYSLSRQKKAGDDFEKWLETVAGVQFRPEEEIVPLESNPRIGS